MRASGAMNKRRNNEINKMAYCVTMFEVNSGFGLGLDKWLGHYAVILGTQSLGFCFQCWHLNVFVLSLECFSAGTQALEYFRGSFSVPAL